MSHPPFTRVVAALPMTTPFVAPEVTERQRGRRFRARLGANECGFGTSPKAAEAMVARASLAWQYCDPENAELRQALAARHGIPAEAIVVGEGVDGLLGVAARVFVEPGTPVVASHGAYPTFLYSVNGAGGALSLVPYRGYFEDLDGLAETAERIGARVVYVANPDNPMGTMWDKAAVQRLLSRLPRDTMLFLDEAYAEFAPQQELLDVDVANTRLIRFRSFSKAYGLAGCRIGFAFGAPQVMAAFNKIRSQFGVNALAQAAALAALEDGEFMRETLAKVSRAKSEIMRIAETNGLKPIPSATNFVTIDTGRDGTFARRLLQELTNRDVFIRMPGVSPLDRCIRVTAGPDAELVVFAEELGKALAAAATVA
jgi:histidinol-phosphate aminotransferase